MTPRLTKFQPKWLTTYSWISSVNGDIFKAYFKLCKKSFSISSKGEASIREHAQGTKHIDVANATKNVQSLDRFFGRKFKFNLNEIITIL